MSAAISASAGAPLNITGLASGLNTNEIISALLAVERKPITNLSNQETTLEGQREQLQSFQSGLSQLTFAAQELGSPTLFNTTQTVSSSDINQVTATTSSGAAIGGYELEVTQLANSAQRTFTFTSPAAAETLTIDGQEITLAAGASIQTLANSINSDSKATVYAAAVNGETLVLSTRATGATGSGFIQVSDPGGTLVEQAGLAKAGRNARIHPRRRRRQLRHKYRDERDRRRHPEPESADDHDRPGHDRRPSARPQRQRHHDPGAGIREPLQLDDRRDREAAEHQAPGRSAERR